MVPPRSPRNAKSLPLPGVEWGAVVPGRVGRGPGGPGISSGPRNLRRPAAVFRDDTKAPERVPAADKRSTHKMNRFSRIFAPALIGAAALAAAALAGGPADSSSNGYGHGGRHGFAARNLQK